MSKANLGKTVLLLLFLAGAVFFALQLRPPRPIGAGDAAPDFTLPAAGGGSLALHDFRHRVVVLNFWATWCPPCVEEIPSLQKFADQTRDSGVVVIGVSEDQNRGSLEKFTAQHHLSYPVAHDSSQSVAARYGTFKYPETFILGRDGRVARKIAGPVDWQNPHLVGAVQALARGR
jgi:peroxiredoxin